jgi:hypothetical protein
VRTLGANKRLEPTRLALPVCSCALGRAAQAERSGLVAHMLKWTLSIAALLACALLAFSLLQGRSLRLASLIGGKNQLLVAYDDLTKRGYVTNYPASGYHVWLSTNIVTIGGIQYQCFAGVGGGWGYDGGRLAMTTNQVFIWLDTERPPKIITDGYRPSVFSKRY